MGLILMKNKDVSSNATSLPDQIGMNIPEPNPLWTVHEVSQYLRLKPETVRAMVRRRKIPAIKIGRVWRFKRELIAEWIQRASESVNDKEENGL